MQIVLDSKNFPRLNEPGASSASAHVAVAIGLCLAAPAYAGPPFVTDDPEPADYRKWEINYALTGTHHQSQPFTPLPLIDVNYGASPGLQLHVQPQMSHISAAEGVRDYVLSGTEIGIKYRLTPEPEKVEDWMVSLYPLYEIPVGNNTNLGIRTPSLYLPIWLQTTRGRWTTYGGGGYWINTGSGNKNSWACGWAVLYQFTQRLQLGGELFASTPTAIENRNSVGFNLGGHYSLARDYTLLFSAGRGLVNTGAMNQGSLYLGLQVIY